MKTNVHITVYVLLCALLPSSDGQQLKNVLFVMADDLRPDIGAYAGDDDTFYRGIQTPNIDRFAADSLLLTRAYAQQALCAPSRASALTGRRPDTTRSYDLDYYWRDIAGNFSTIPQYFKENGYTSIGVGKIFHSGEVHGRDDREYSWSETPFREPGDEMWETKAHSWQVAEPEYDDTVPQRDTIIKDYAIEKMNELAPAAISGERPFFLAVGFQRPHLPHVAPRRFYELYNRSDIRIASNPHVPTDFPNIAYSTWGELRSYEDVAALNIPVEYNTTLPDDFAIDLRLAYYATISFVDSLFGELLDELDALGLADNTVVVFFSDNGYQLGEHSEWVKHTNLEVAAQVPVILRLPGVTDGGIVSSGFVELVDIFPTLADASGLADVTPVPQCPLDSQFVLLCHEGHSFLPLTEGHTGDWKTAAFYQYIRNSGTRMGYVIRTDNYQYVRWVEFKGIPLWNSVRDEELYDLQTDVNMNVNVAGREEYADVIAELDVMLRAGWRSVLPTTQ